jgi:FlaA1/EpsC-like NDP-sugar epimerase
MGTTKLLGEKLMVAANYYRGRHRTAFSCVRFGNVLGSRGSAPLLFREQALAGQPITLTDPRMTRFIMSMGDAVRLVLKAVSMTRGGETFILKMGAVNMGDVAAVIGEHLGSAKVSQTGIKPGEKLYEELVTEEELPRAFETSDMYIVLSSLPELWPVDVKAYPGAKPAGNVPYRSDRVPKLTRKEIAQLITREGLL